MKLTSFQLFRHLQKTNSDLANDCIKLVQNVTPILDTISTIFPFYTQHNASHSERIVSRISQILDPGCFQRNNKKLLSGIECYLLIVSAYTHDLGMAVFQGEEKELCATLGIDHEDGWQQSKNLQKHLRKTHSSRGYDYLEKNKNNLSIPIHQLSHVKYLIGAHNAHTQTLKEDQLRKFAACEDVLNLPQLASILCVADALEFSDTRVKDGVLDHLSTALERDPNEELFISYRENMKHLSIGGNLAVDKTGQVVVNGTFEDPEVLNLAHKTFDEIEAWLRDYLEIDAASLVPRFRIRHHSIHRELHYTKGSFERLGIRMKKENIINLISSKSVWNNDHSVAVKELLQNAVEACRYRDFLSSKAERYAPKITVRFDKIQHSIVVQDNGCGMSRSTILNHFLTVGNTRSTSSEYKRQDYYPLARFGIGFWSCFTIVDSVRVETRAMDSLESAVRFDVSIGPLQDFLTFSPIEREIGTTLILSLKKGTSTNDIYTKLLRHIICSEIPVEITNNAEKIKIPSTLPKQSFEQIVGPKHHFAQKEGVRVFFYEKVMGDIDFSTAIIYIRRNGLLSFCSEDRYAVRMLFSDWGGMEIINAICGFTVNTPHVYTPFHTSISNCIANVRNPKGFTFSIDRRNLLSNEAYSNFLCELTRNLNSAYKAFLLENDLLDPENVYRLNRESTTQIRGGIGFDKRQVDLVFAEFPELITFKLYRIKEGLNLENCPVEFVDVSQIQKLDAKIITYSPSYSRHNKIHFDESKADHAYNILSGLKEFQNCFFHEWTNEIGLIFELDKSAYLHKLEVPFKLGMSLIIPFLIVNPSNVRLNCWENEAIGRVQGIWSGDIELRKIVGGKFAFTHNGFIVDPTTLLAVEVVRLYEEGELTRLCSFINLIQISESGFINEAIQEYL